MFPPLPHLAGWRPALCHAAARAGGGGCTSELLRARPPVGGAQPAGRVAGRRRARSAPRLAPARARRSAPCSPRAAAQCTRLKRRPRRRPDRGHAATPTPQPRHRDPLPPPTAFTLRCGHLLLPVLTRRTRRLGRHHYHHPHLLLLPLYLRTPPGHHRHPQCAFPTSAQTADDVALQALSPTLLPARLDRDGPRPDAPSTAATKVIPTWRPASQRRPPWSPPSASPTPPWRSGQRSPTWPRRRGS